MDFFNARSTTRRSRHLRAAGADLRAPLRIALVAPPMVAVPPPRYGGTERVVDALARALAARGHDVTVYASGDSRVPCRLVATVPTALWSEGFRGDVRPSMAATADRVLRDQASYDVIHAHLDGEGLRLARRATTPVVNTLHGRLDTDEIQALLSDGSAVPMVAISESQRRWNPAANWLATIHHGLDFDDAPFGETAADELLVVGRATAEKGIAEAIEVARAVGMPLRIAAKVHDTAEVAYFDEVIKPQLRLGDIEFLGEVGRTERDQLLSRARATLMLGRWPEPFGLVAIESLVTGTPVIARRAGALPEIVAHGIDGFLVDDLTEAVLAVRRAGDLDRARIRSRALARFSADRMAAEYESVYRALVARALDTRPPTRRSPLRRSVLARVQPATGVAPDVAVAAPSVRIAGAMAGAARTETIGIAAKQR